LSKISTRGRIHASGMMGARRLSWLRKGQHHWRLRA
jgi:hypothetical protein